MADHVFYKKGRNKGHIRKLEIRSAQLLIGKKPTNAKRIKLKVVMGISTQKHAGAPEWITNAYEFVSRSHDPVFPAVNFQGYNVAFSTDNLFGNANIAATRCQLNGFSIEEMGDSENPDVVLKFTVYAPFATQLWEWVGQMGGDEIFASFEQGTIEEDEPDQDELELTGESEDEAEEESDEDEDDE